jgi:hypothetical protein
VTPTENIRRGGTYITGEPLLDAYASTQSLRFLDDRLVQPNNNNKSLLSLKVVKDIMTDRARSNSQCKEQSVKMLMTREFLELRDEDFCPPRKAILDSYLAFLCQASYASSTRTRANTAVGNTICVPLGCHFPIVLRETQSRNYKFVGICCLYGMMDSEALLGPLPPEWEARAVLDMTGTYWPRYWNRQTNISTQDDPRLGDLSAD